MDAGSKPPALERLKALLKVGYVELQYWLVGLTPEDYHLHQSRSCLQLGDYRRSAYHCLRLLELTEHAELRARLGYCYTMLARYAEAVDQYHKAIRIWPHPVMLLGLAQVEILRGNRPAATALMERVERSEMRQRYAAAMAEVRSAMQAAD